MQTAIAAQDPAVRVTCAYLDYLPPQLPDALSALVAEHAPAHILIVPVFLGAGGHVTEDVPRLVDAARQAHPHIHFHLSQNIGDRPELSALVAQLTLGDLQHCTSAAASSTSAASPAPASSRPRPAALLRTGSPSSRGSSARPG